MKISFSCPFTYTNFLMQIKKARNVRNIYLYNDLKLQDNFQPECGFLAKDAI